MERQIEQPLALLATTVKQLSQLHIEGLRSINTADIEMRSLNLLIGANGAGKSIAVNPPS